jgi:hypothetical protein
MERNKKPPYYYEGLKLISNYGYDNPKTKPKDKDD